MPQDGGTVPAAVAASCAAATDAVARHARGPGPACRACRQRWPCDARRLALRLVDLLPAAAPGRVALTPAPDALSVALLRWRNARHRVHRCRALVHALARLGAAGAPPLGGGIPLALAQRRALEQLSAAQEDLSGTRADLDRVGAGTA